MIRHIVLTRFKPETSESKIASIYAGLSDVTEALSGAHHFGGGRSHSPEQIERGYRHGFSVDFDSWEDLQTYTDNEKHKALGRQIVANAQDGLDGVLVLDIEI